jgi:hypothetical protein
MTTLAMWECLVEIAGAWDAGAGNTSLQPQRAARKPDKRTAGDEKKRRKGDVAYQLYVEARAVEVLHRG